MNRQFRRAQEKQDKRQEKEKAKKRQERRSRLRQMRGNKKAGSGSNNAASNNAASSNAKERGGQSEQKPAARGRTPGRFAGVLAAVTVFFITLQGVAPAEQDETMATRLIGAGFYLMLGYFATLWFMRRNVARAPLMSVVGGVLLAASVTVAAMVQGREYDLLVLALVVPALIVGALLGRLVFVATPR